MLRARPQDIPSSSALLLLSVVLVLVSGVVSMLSSVGGLTQAVMISLLDLAMTLVLLAVSLNIMGLSSRLIQTATAMFGTGVIINMVSIPVVILLNGTPENSEYSLLGALLYFALLVWSVVVMGHILRHSFNLRFSGGILIAIAYFLMINTLVQTFLLTA